MTSLASVSASIDRNATASGTKGVSRYGIPPRVFPSRACEETRESAECLVYSLTPSGFLGPKNRGFVGILRGQKCLKRGQKCLKRRFPRRSPVGEWSRGTRCAAAWLSGRGLQTRRHGQRGGDRARDLPRYAELGSVRLLKEELEAGGINRKSWTSTSGRVVGGKPFSRGALYLILQNRISRGSGSPEMKLHRRGR